MRIKCFLICLTFLQVWYQMVALKYYFPKLADMYLGIVLKAHRFRAAESIQFCLGKRF